MLVYQQLCLHSISYYFYNHIFSFISCFVYFKIGDI